MKQFVPWLGAMVLALSAGSLAQAQVKDPAELLPAQTLACVEFRHPDKMAREMGLLIKGSSLEDIASTMAKFRARMPKNEEWWSTYQIGTMGMFVCPEMLSEFSRFQGGILALTGVSKDKGPKWVGVLLSGESNIPGLYMRAMLTMSGEMKPVGEVEGVMVYRERRRNYNVAPAQPGQPPPPPTEEDGVAMAMMSGMLLFGSTPDEVKDVILRGKGKSNDPSLTSMRAFKDAAKLREQPGLFAYADMEALAGQMEEAIKAMTPVQKAEWNQFKTIVNPRAFRAATASLTVQNSNVELQMTVKTVPGQTSPLLELLGDKKADAQLFQYVPRDSVLTLSLGVSEGEKRWAKIVELLDALAKDSGESELNLPSKKFKEVEDELKMSIGKDVLGRLNGGAVSFTMDPKGEPIPLLVFSAADVDSAKALEEKAIPKLAKFVGRDLTVEAELKDIDGVKVNSIPMPGLLPGGKILYYARHGSTVVVGRDGRRVALAVTSGSKKDGLLSDAKYAAALKEVDGSVTVGVGSLGTAIVALLREQELSRGGFAQAVPIGPNGAKPPALPEPKLNDRAEKAIKEMTKHVEALPPLVVTLNRKGDTLVLEARQMGLKTVSVKVIDLWIESALQRSVERNGRNFGIGVGAAPGAAPPAPPVEIPDKKD